MFVINTGAMLSWMKENQIILGLIASAFVGTMPEILPGFRDFPQWLWTWCRDAVKLFLNFRRTSLPTPTIVQHGKSTTETLTLTSPETQIELNRELNSQRG